VRCSPLSLHLTRYGMTSTYQFQAASRLLMRHRARRLAERADRCHILTMAKTYSIVHLNDTSSYGVEITAPDRIPHTVTGFNTEADAQAWMTDQKRLEAAAERAWGEGID
jgi:hypothetical protein